MSITRPTIQTLMDRARADIAGRLSGAYVLARRTLLGIIIKTHVGGMDGLYGFLAKIIEQLIWDSATGIYLQRWASIFSVQKKSATKASGPVVVAGSIGATIDDQAVLVRADEAQFLVSGPVTFTATTMTVTVKAVDAGTAGNTDLGTSLTFETPPSGVTATATVGDGGIAGGTDDEKDDALKSRFLASVRSVPQGGASNDYVRWATNQPEVTRAWTFRNWMGPGTVGVAFLMDNREDIFPTAADVMNLKAALDPLAPVTADVVPFSPPPAPVNFVMTVVPDSAFDAAAAALKDLFTSEAVPGGTMLISRMRGAVEDASGVTDYTMASPAANFMPGTGAMPIVGTVTRG